MEKFNIISEKIDNYILNRMDSAELCSFEKEMHDSPSLRKEVELQKDIVLGIQTAFVKKCLHKAEQEMRKGRMKTVKYISRYAIAASIVCICICGIDLKYSSDLKNQSSIYFAELQAPYTRSDNPIDESLLRIYDNIESEEFSSALDELEETMVSINAILAVPIENNLDEYQHKIAIAQKHEAEWYHAIILMKKGKLVKSRRILKRIATSDSPYSSDAAEILENIYSFNINKL